jgi:glucokinase
MVGERRAGADVRFRYLIGIDAGATNIKGVAVDRSGKVQVKRQTRVESDLSRALFDVVADLRGEIGTLPDAYGIAAPGIASADGKSIWWMQGRAAGVQGFDWDAELNPPDFPHTPYSVLNDAHAALLGEVWTGAATGCRNVILLTLGTGVGGAAMVDGNLLRGHIGRAGHLGHISLDPKGPLDIVNTPGSLEDAIGECTLARRSGGRFTSAAQLLAADDDDARAIWQTSIRSLACGLASLINVLDPELVVLGGGMTAAGDRLFAPLRIEMEKFEWRPHGRAVRIVPAAAGEYAGAIGAAYFAMNLT